MPMRFRALRRFFFRSLQLFIKIISKFRQQLFPQFSGSTDSSTKSFINSSSKQKQQLQDLVIVITGSSRGIGLALAKCFLKEGSSVVINGRQAQHVEAAFQACQKISDRVEAVVADLTVTDDVKRCMTTATERFGRIDLLINNAAIVGPEEKKLWNVSQAAMFQALSVNVVAPFLCASEVIRMAEKSKQSVRVINVSSGIVGYGAAEQGLYNTTKTALEGLTTSFVADFEKDGFVSMLNVHPRTVKTDMNANYLTRMEYELLDEPEVMFPLFRYAALAPAGEIMGKTLSDPRFAIDPKAEIYLADPSSAFPEPEVSPETFQKKIHEVGEEDGGYLHLLQNPLGMYPAVEHVLKTQAIYQQMCRYPDPCYLRLREALSRFHHLDPNHFTFGCGSSDIIIRAIRALGGNKSKIIITRPTWGSCVWTTVLKSGLIPVEVPHLGSLREQNIRHDLEGILKAIDERTRVIYLVNPCNPTGSLLDKEVLATFLQQVPSHVAVLLDEAYIGYAEPERIYDLASNLDQIKSPVIGLRTFSKFYALSGMRVGYAYGRPDDLALIDRWSGAFNVSAIAEKTAIAALEDKQAQDRVYKHIHYERQRIYSTFDTLNIHYMPTQTSFIMFDCPADRFRMRTILQEKGLFLPNLDDAVEKNYAVFPIGKKDHNDRMVEYLKSV